MTADKAFLMPFLVKCRNDLIVNTFLALCTDVFRSGTLHVAILAEIAAVKIVVCSDWMLTFVAHETFFVELCTVNVEVPSNNVFSAFVTAVIWYFCHIFLFL